MLPFFFFGTIVRKEDGISYTIEYGFKEVRLTN